MSLLNPYCTVQQVRDLIRNQDSTITTQLEDAINAASRFIDQYKGRDYFLHDYSSTALVIDKWSGCVFSELLVLPYRPVINITEVIVGTQTYLAGTDYKRSDQDGILISLDGVWPEESADQDAIRIKGKFGYDQTASTAVPTGIPANITAACVEIAAAVSRHNLKDIVNLDGTKTSIHETDIPKSAFQLLGGKGRLLV